MNRGYDGSPLASQKQINLIMHLAQQIQDAPVRRLSDVKCISLTQRERNRGGMTMSEASAHIDTLIQHRDRLHYGQCHNCGLPLDRSGWCEECGEQVDLGALGFGSRFAY